MPRPAVDRPTPQQQGTNDNHVETQSFHNNIPVQNPSLLQVFEQALGGMDQNTLNGLAVLINKEMTHNNGNVANANVQQHGQMSNLQVSTNEGQMVTQRVPQGQNINTHNGAGSLNGVGQSVSIQSGQQTDATTNLGHVRPLSNQVIRPTATGSHVNPQSHSVASMTHTHISGGQIQSHNLQTNNQQQTNTFDPNGLLASMAALSAANYDPGAFNTNQKYVNTQQWNVAGQTGSQLKPEVPVTHALSGSSQQHPIQPNPNQASGSNANRYNDMFLNGAQMNFEPNAMMGGSLDTSNKQFAFNPNEVNKFSGGFNPGNVLMASSGMNSMGGSQTSMYNADNINQMLMSYSKNTPQQPVHQQQQIQPLTQQTPKPQGNSWTHMKTNKNLTQTNIVHPGNGNLPAGISSKEVVPFNIDVGISNSFRPGAIVPDSGSKESINYAPVHPVSKAAPSRQTTGNRGIFAYSEAFKTMTFNPDAVNSGQTIFNPEKVMKGFLATEERYKSDPLAQLLRSAMDMGNDNETRVVVNITTSPPNDIKGAGAENGRDATTTSTTTATSDFPKIITTTATPSSTMHAKEITQMPYVINFNPDSVNTPLSQTQVFSMGNFGQGPISSGQSNNGFSKFSNGFQPGMTPFIQGEVTDQNSDKTNDKEINSNSGSNSYGYGSMGMFDPSKVNNAKMTFDIDSHMGFYTGNGNSGSMYDPVKTGQESIQSPFMSNGTTSEAYSYGSQFLATNGMNLVDNSAFVGQFDPNGVNQQAFVTNDLDVNSPQNRTDGTSMFLGMNGFGGDLGSLGMGNLGGGSGESAFIGDFDPSSVNNVVFNPDKVNSVHMNFDPKEMLSKNPGYDSSLSTSFKFNPNKVNDVHMNFLPAFVQNGNQIDSSGENNQSTANTITFTPGEMSPGNDQSSFNPSNVNSAMTNANPLSSMLNNIPGTDTNSNKQNSTAYEINFDPNKVNQVNFKPMDNNGNTYIFNPTKLNNMESSFNPFQQNIEQTFSASQIGSTSIKDGTNHVSGEGMLFGGKHVIGVSETTSKPIVSATTAGQLLTTGTTPFTTHEETTNVNYRTTITDSNI